MGRPKAKELTERELERKLTRDAGLSRTVAQTLMRGGFEAIKVKRDADSDDAKELQAALLRLAKA